MLGVAGLSDLVSPFFAGWGAPLRIMYDMELDSHRVVIRLYRVKKIEKDD